jgi:hypothetical protein
VTEIGDWRLGSAEVHPIHVAGEMATGAAGIQGMSWSRPNRVCCVCGSITCEGMGSRPQDASKRCKSHQQMLQHLPAGSLCLGKAAASQPTGAPVNDACLPLWVPPGKYPPANLGEEVVLYADLCKRECCAADEGLKRCIQRGGVLRKCSELAAATQRYKVVDMAQYGSRSVGLALPGISDMDCVVIVEEEEEAGYIDGRRDWTDVQKHLVRDLAEVMRNHDEDPDRRCSLVNVEVGPCRPIRLSCRPEVNPMISDTECDLQALTNVREPIVRLELEFGYPGGVDTIIVQVDVKFVLQEVRVAPASSSSSSSSSSR